MKFSQMVILLLLFMAAAFGLFAVVVMAGAS